MDVLLSKKVLAGLFCIILIQVFFLLFYRQEIVKKEIPNQNYPGMNIPGDFVSILSFHYLFSLNKGSLQGMTVNNNFSGIITKIYNSPNVHLNFSYEKAIEIVENKGKNTILITKSALTSLSVSNLSKNPIPFEDLKVGDSVKILETLDLSQRHPLADQRIVIVKLNQ